MPVARTRSVALLGLTGSVVEVEADLSSQLPGFVIIGLPDAALAEARERVRSAARQLRDARCRSASSRSTSRPPRCRSTARGSTSPSRSPASPPPARCPWSPSIASSTWASWDSTGGSGRSTGSCPRCSPRREPGIDTVMVPTANAAEAALVPGVEVIGVGLAARSGDPARRRVRRRPRRAGARPHAHRGADAPAIGDLADVAGNDDAVDALLTAAAGGHHLYLLGPPGAGKTMLASRLPGILPDLDADAALEVSSHPLALRATARRRAHHAPAVRGAAPHRHRRGDRRRRQPA